jgi:hypothetical protein
MKIQGSGKCGAGGSEYTMKSKPCWRCSDANDADDLTEDHKQITTTLQLKYPFILFKTIDKLLGE